MVELDLQIRYMDEGDEAEVMEVWLGARLASEYWIPNPDLPRWPDEFAELGRRYDTSAAD